MILLQGNSKLVTVFLNNAITLPPPPPYLPPSGQNPEFVSPHPIPYNKHLSTQFFLSCTLFLTPLPLEKVKCIFNKEALQTGPRSDLVAGLRCCCCWAHCCWRDPLPGPSGRSSRQRPDSPSQRCWQKCKKYPGNYYSHHGYKVRYMYILTELP